MYLSKYLTILFSFFLVANNLFGQPLICPPNIDFEAGSLSNWTFYTGNCCPINTPVLSGAVANRHTLVNGTALDQYGNFPIVSPNGGGSHSLKLGNNANGGQAEKARYYIHVPANQNNYSLIYRYAVVFQNPNHAANIQPRFDVNVYDSTTNTPLACNQFTYVSSANLPGFQLSPTGTQVWYKPWTTGTLDLSGLAGKTIIVDFTTADCGAGGHFGYGYVDMSCGLFAVEASACAAMPVATLTGPPGFQSYQWYDATFSNLVGTGQVISMPTPANNTIFRLVLTPYPGYGCPDTLSTVIVLSDLSINLLNQNTTLCNGHSLQLNTITANGYPPVNFSWSPTAGLSCITCPNPVVTPPTSNYYVVSVTDSTGCVLKDSVYVGVSPDVKLTVQDIQCFGQTNGSASASVTGIAPFTYHWNTTPPQTTPSINNLTAGTYTVTVTDNLSCTQSKSAIITQPISPLNVNVTNVTHVNCYAGSTGSVSLSVNGGTPPYTYHWNTTPVITTQNATGLSAGTYTVTVTDLRGCAETRTITINEPTQPLGAIVISTGAGCVSASNGTLNTAVTGGTPPYTYTWNTTPAQTTQTATGLSAGTYTVTVTDSRNCATTASGTIGIVLPWSASIAVVSPATCHGGSNGSATVTTNGGAPPFTYVWNTTPPQTTATATNLPAGIHTVVVLDNIGCSDTVSATIGQPSAVVPVTNVVNISCNGAGNGSASVTATGGTPPYTYSWNTTPAQTTQTINNLLPGTYIVAVTDAAGCVKTKNALVTQPAVLTATINSFQHVSCFNGQNGSASVYVTGGTAPYTYSWNTVPAKTTATVTNLAAGTYTVNIIDSKGCTTNKTVIINQPATAVSATINAVTDANCYGSANGTATVVAQGGTAPYAYTWSTNPVQTASQATGLIAGNYSVTVTDAKGCIANANATIQQPAQLVVKAVVQQHTCPGAADGRLSTTVTGGTPPYSYQWNTTPIQTTSGIQNLPVGMYIVTVQDDNSCIGYATTAINNFELSLSAGNDTTICQGDSILLKGSGGVGYLWSPSASVVCSTCQSTFAHPATSTTYYLYARDQQYNCSDTDEIVVTVLERGNVAVGDSLKICEGDVALLTAEGGIQYSWWPAENLDTSWKAAPKARPLKDTRYQVIITQNICFKDTLYQHVAVYPQPAVDLGPDITVIANEPIQLSAKLVLATKITWTPPDGLSCTDCTEPVARVNGTTTYIATGETSHGCKATDSITIHVNCDGSVFYIPNTFSPNGDGINDVFYPRGPDIKSLSYFQIYNRWGERVFEARNIPTNDRSSGWDGTYRGVKVDPDVFVYMIELNCASGKPLMLKGDISVVR